MTSRQAAAVLGVGERTLYYYLRDRAKTGFPEPKRFGTTLMWVEDELREWRKTHPARRRKVVDTNPEPTEGTTD